MPPIHRRISKRALECAESESCFGDCGVEQKKIRRKRNQRTNPSPQRRTGSPPASCSFLAAGRIQGRGRNSAVFDATSLFLLVLVSWTAGGSLDREGEQKKGEAYRVDEMTCVYQL